MPSYTEVAISNYNAATAPSDDGTVTATNKIQWSIIKTKLSDPLKTAIDSIDDNVATAISTITTNLTTANTNLTAANTSYSATILLLYAPSGTAGLFFQTAAPTGWTKGSTHNDKALRLVSGAVSTGGSTAFSSIFTSRTIAEANMPSHTHTWSSGTVSVSFSPTTTIRTDVDSSFNNDVAAGGSSVMTGIDKSTAVITGTGSVSGTSGSAGSGTAMDFAVRYVDIITATKS